jgi:hypothetical protein
MNWALYGLVTFYLACTIIPLYLILSLSNSPHYIFLKAVVVLFALLALVNSKKYTAITLLPYLVFSAGLFCIWWILSNTTASYVCLLLFVLLTYTKAKTITRVGEIGSSVPLKTQNSKLANLRGEELGRETSKRMVEGLQRAAKTGKFPDVS